MYIFVQVYGDGAKHAQAGLQATFYIRLRDRGSNIITDPAVYVYSRLSASLVAVSDPYGTSDVPVKLAFVSEEHAFRATFTAQISSVYPLNLTFISATPYSLSRSVYFITVYEISLQPYSTESLRNVGIVMMQYHKK